MLTFGIPVGQSLFDIEILDDEGLTSHFHLLAHRHSGGEDLVELIRKNEVITAYFGTFRIMCIVDFTRVRLLANWREDGGR